MQLSAPMVIFLILAVAVIVYLVANAANKVFKLVGVGICVLIIIAILPTVAPVLVSLIDYLGYIVGGFVSAFS